MSGTGQFRNVRGARIGAFSVLAREHLGDRLAAFVDGELGGDARDRVLSHLASCDPCRGEADEQRRLKTAVADALPPALSAGLLARLQGLPGCDHDDLAGPGPDTPLGLFGRGGFGGPDGRPGDDPRGGGRPSFLTPAAPLGGDDGFPIHEFGRSASRGRRLAFAAAGAFSLAALAIGASLPLDGVSGAAGSADPGPATTATPLSMRQVADQRAATAGAGGTSPAPVTAAERSLPAVQGGRSPLGVTGSAAHATPRPGGDTPGPSAVPVAPWTTPSPARAARPAPHPSATPVRAAPRAPAPPAVTPQPTPPVVTVVHASPEPLPMGAGAAAQRLLRPPIGGHPY